MRLSARIPMGKTRNVTRFECEGWHVMVLLFFFLPREGPGDCLPMQRVSTTDGNSLTPLSTTIGQTTDAGRVTWFGMTIWELDRTSQRPRHAPLGCRCGVAACVGPPWRRRRLLCLPAWPRFAMASEKESCQAVEGRRGRSPTPMLAALRTRETKLNGPACIGG